jgi:hypothetical protein
MKYYILIYILIVYIFTMTRYSVKRGRRIKKYKKSRKLYGRRGRGRERERRSIRSGKSRKSKIFMKTKRNNVRKRRRMVGGLECKGYNFNITVVEVQEYVARKYRSDYLDLVTLTLISFGIVLVTNADKGSLLKTYNRPEQVAIFKGNDGHIYIARGRYPYDSTDSRQGNTLGVLKVNIESDIMKFEGELPKKDEIAGNLKALGCTIGTQPLVTYTIKDEWGDDYRISVYESDIFTPVCEFFNKHEFTTEAKPINISALFATLETLKTSVKKKLFVQTLRQVKYPVNPIAAAAAAAAAAEAKTVAAAATAADEKRREAAAAAAAAEMFPDAAAAEAKTVAAPAPAQSSTLVPFDFMHNPDQ